MAETVGVPLISVVVPTRDRSEQLGACLAALERQTASEMIEVIVVDDGSANRAAIEEAVAGRPRVRLVRQAGAGPAAARNRGVRAARGAYICLTDDDCEPRAEWVERLAASLKGGAAAAAGVTLSGSQGDPLAEASELIAGALSPAANGEEGLAFAPSNNLGCRAELLAALPFDETFPVAAGEDRDWCARLRAAGHVLVREPAAVVVHRQQLGLDDFWNQQVRYGRGAFRFRRSSGDRSLESPLFYARLVRQGFRGGVRIGLLVALAQVGAAVGFTAEWKRSRATRAGGEAQGSTREQVSPSSGGQGGHTHEMVDDVERQARGHDGGATLSPEQPIEGLVEHDNQDQ
jgi:glycosyltransferase involved in cell wall biosynthesis